MDAGLVAKRALTGTALAFWQRAANLPYLYASHMVRQEWQPAGRSKMGMAYMESGSHDGSQAHALCLRGSPPGQAVSREPSYSKTRADSFLVTFTPAL